MRREFATTLGTTLTLTLLLALGIFGSAFAQTQQAGPPAIEVVDVPLIAWVGSRAHATPETLSNFTSDATRLTEFRALVEALAKGEWGAASQRAKGVSYQLAAIHEADTWFVIASDDSATGRDPIIVVNTAPKRDLILGAPHVPFEPGTGEQALILLRDLAVRAAIISGAHRCASKSFTACDGTTAVCGSLQGYRDSDAGHNTNTLFHVSHLALAELWSNSVVMSLHGMMEDTDGVRTSLIISNGIHGEDGGQQTVATKLRLAVQDAFGPAGTVVSCNVPADDVFKYRKLCGYTNIQGRHVNGSVDVCRPSKGVPHISKVPGFASPRPAANCRDLPRHTAAAGSPPGPRHRTETTKPSGAQSDPTPRQILLAGSALRIDLRWTAQYSRILRIETDLAVDFAQLERAWRIDQPPNPQ